MWQELLHLLYLQEPLLLLMLRLLLGHLLMLWLLLLLLGHVLLLRLLLLPGHLLLQLAGVVGMVEAMAAGREAVGGLLLLQLLLLLWLPCRP